MCMKMTIRTLKQSKKWIDKVKNDNTKNTQYIQYKYRLAHIFTFIWLQYPLTCLIWTNVPCCCSTLPWVSPQQAGQMVKSHQLGETDNELVCNSGKTKHLLFLTDRILKKQNLKVKEVVLPEVPLRTLLWLWLLLRRWHAHLFHFTPWPVIWLISWNRGWFILCLYWTGQWNWWYTEFGLCPHTDRLCLYLDS